MTTKCVLWWMSVCSLCCSPPNIHALLHYHIMYTCIYISKRMLYPCTSNNFETNRSSSVLDVDHACYACGFMTSFKTQAYPKVIHSMQMVHTPVVQNSTISNRKKHRWTSSNVYLFSFIAFLYSYRSMELCRQDRPALKTDRHKTQAIRWNDVKWSLVNLAKQFKYIFIAPIWQAVLFYIPARIFPRTKRQMRCKEARLILPVPSGCTVRFSQPPSFSSSFSLN